MTTKQKNASLACQAALMVSLLASLLAGCGNNPGTSGNSGGTLPSEPATSSSRDFGNYVLYFNAIRTDTLTPEIARTYNIARSANRALVNISIVKKTEGTPGVPVPGRVTVQAVNLNGQLKDLTVREIREGTAI